jgi:hypothetical protein
MSNHANDKERNLLFALAWCETNLRWLAGERMEPEAEIQRRYMFSEIERLKKEIAETKKEG